MNSAQDTFKSGTIASFPTLFGYMSIGIAFGVVGVASNLSVLEITLLSILIYAGAAQFIFCGLYLVGTPMSVIIFTTFIVNLRHLLMALAIAPSFTKYSVLRNIGFGTLLTDESFGVAIAEKAKSNTLHGKWMDGLNVTAYLAWIAASIIGAFVGNWIPSPEKFGLDFALSAMFIALLVLTISASPKSKIMHYLKLIGVMVFVIYGLLYIFPSHLAVIVSTLIVATIGVVTERK
ncbi:transporter [Kurthia zopfii]|uniref:4-azaleucine resistance transporter AzlC n=1 Tax=Kurthia zopfii TaxID=1650 RepID=A0A8B4QB19_9BACL|nr:AzlC family ABC transporter permease [Kurthia zopfii]PWI23213.1 branched-chain amino acid ABC transporter permease [Kurthia zopfii]TDR41392.1 4-azaleucine resistance transporter AzlC [Kurthia zopfii]GEK30036.1 transporter [Kurthia zopfii]STX09897.1 Inner membrane protein YgaZ [Kurthia zopfii]